MYEEVKQSGLVSEPVDWALESNQSNMRRYSQHIGQKEFEVPMEKAAEIVVQLNERHSSMAKRDNRLKLE